MSPVAWIRTHQKREARQTYAPVLSSCPRIKFVSRHRGAACTDPCSQLPSFGFARRRFSSSGWAAGSGGAPTLGAGLGVLADPGVTTEARSSCVLCWGARVCCYRTVPSHAPRSAPLTPGCGPTRGRGSSHFVLSSTACTSIRGSPPALGLPRVFSRGLEGVTSVSLSRLLTFVRTSRRKSSFPVCNGLLVFSKRPRAFLLILGFWQFECDVYIRVVLALAFTFLETF